MRIREVRRLRREAFTLIELLVVIAIIAVLASLLLAAVMNVLTKKPQVKFRSEASQLDGSVQAFLTKYGVDYMPSRLKLCQNAKSYNTSVALDQESLTYITKTIGRNSPTFLQTWQTTGINWAGSNTPPVEILEGEQCLVFFLGGIQSSSGPLFTCHGFGPDAAHPDNLATSAADNIGPFYNFESPRLSPPTTKANAVYCAYADAYFGGLRADSKPRYYAYFSRYKKADGYNHYRADGSLVSTAGKSPVSSDCASLGVWPYASTPATPTTPLVYVNSNSWQIICSGFDGNFGPGTDPTSATPYYWNQTTAGAIPAAGADDQANFAFGKLQFGK